ncbi:uncharacterized protein LOC128558979 isoform X1 [Mercenaria mercenaria]|uniref:uncharacterized protein LOC128558979 isoform X1 n=1 Tax=Mercenaria mercenaria TaxID=6596 RepID=UPI00234EFCAD|nr:uncharacterized protein LOC128558979 isoform X1 [Mercenaria mercenaria]
MDNSIIDDKIERLRHTIFDIASKQSHWGEHIPAKWITLERKIVSEKDLGKKVLYKNQLRDLNGELLVSIETDEELELFLRFHHESGNILYFRDTQLSDSIVLDPQWLIDAFKSIITEKTFYKRNQTILQNWLEFEKSAKLTDGFLDMVWEKSEFYEHKDLLLRYLQKLGFIVKPRQQSNSAKVKVGMVHNVQWDGKSDVDDAIILASGTEKEMRFHFHDTEPQSTQPKKRIRLEQPEATDYYFVPCILKTPPKEELLTSVNCGHQNSTSKLCFKTASGFLPTAVFNQLLAACINKWPLFESNNEYMLYCGFGVFDIEECHTLFVSFYDHEIQLWITNDQEPENDICANIYTFVHSFLQNDCGLSRDLKTFLRCPAASVRSNERRFSIDEVAKQKNVKCKCTSPNHVLLTENLTRYWFIESTDSIYENDRELSEQDLTTIASFIGRNWQILGSKLGLTEVEIQHIEDDNRNSTVKQILTMLHKWRREVSSEAKSVCNLYKAMKSCNDVVKFEWKSIKSVFNGK